MQGVRQHSEVFSHERAKRSAAGNAGAPMKSPAADPALTAAIIVLAALVGLGAGAMGCFVVAAFRGG
jgi:hypothetical protein